MITTAISYIFLGIALALLILFFGILVKGGITKKYKVTLSNNQIYHVYRKWYDGFNDPKDLKVYRLDLAGKKRLAVGTHWIITIEDE